MDSPTAPRAAKGHFLPRPIGTVALLAVGVAVISLINTRMATGLAPWLLCIPLRVICLRALGVQFAILGASVCSIFLVVGFLLSQHGAAIEVEIFNRAFSIVASWAAVLGGRAYLQSLD